MTQPALHTSLTVDAYLAGEDGSDVRHEYIAGQVYAMTGASDRHGLITLNIATALRPRVRGTGCQLFANDMKVRLRVGADDLFYYPDVLLSCDPSDREVYFRSRPCLIVEVLSESTERIDRIEKLLAYQTIASLQEYLLIAQHRPEVWVHRRARDWAGELVTDGAVRLDCLGYDLPLATIYEEVALDAGP
ncbi:Uma2 family endonuclease [Thioalkalicoccus limnaeus]|uniref:Uma2 family endonuclease n=1 Tax=Thioalkalicoccus limnaeus TaxID=120681 RepID=A0ABV4BEU0_9GAMM